MLLVIDVGNTHTVLGVYEDSQLRNDWRIHTERNTTEDEFNVLINSLFSADNIYLNDIDQTIISCVVPPMVTILDAFCRKYLGHPPQWVDAKNCAGMPILLKNPAEVGADRIVNAVAAFHKYRASLIVVDFGTATTFDAISQKGEYIGGAISPPENVIGKDTIGSIKSGIIFGYAGLVDGIVRRMQMEMGTDPKVIATGGLAELLFDVSETIEAVEPALTLEGLRLIANQAST
jgi:type III pantothenate kinase